MKIPAGIMVWGTAFALYSPQGGVVIQTRDTIYAIRHIFIVGVDELA